MTVPKFTPGPWAAREIDDDGYEIYAIATGERICDFGGGQPYDAWCGTCPSSDDEKLILAAPQLAMTLHALLQGVQAHLSAFDLNPEIEAAADALRAAGIDVRQPE